MQGAPIAIGETVDEMIGGRAKSGKYDEGDPEENAETQHSRSRRGS